MGIEWMEEANSGRVIYPAGLVLTVLALHAAFPLTLSITSDHRDDHSRTSRSEGSGAGLSHRLPSVAVNKDPGSIQQVARLLASAVEGVSELSLSFTQPNPKCAVGVTCVSLA